MARQVPPNPIYYRNKENVLMNKKKLVYATLAAVLICSVAFLGCPTAEEVADDVITTTPNPEDEAPPTNPEDEAPPTQTEDDAPPPPP